MLNEKFKKRLERRVYSRIQFQRAGRLERLLIHMTEPETHKLSDKETRLLHRLQEVYPLISDSGSRADSIDAIMKEFGCTRAHAATLYEDASELFGQMLQVDKRFDRAVLREQLYKLYEMAEAANDFAEARQCLAQIIKLEGLNEKEEGPKIKAPEIPKPVFTNDPKALLSASTEEE